LRIYDASPARIAFELVRYGCAVARRIAFFIDSSAVPRQRLLGQRLLGRPAFPSGVLAFLRMVPKVHPDRLTPNAIVATMQRLEQRHQSVAVILSHPSHCARAGVSERIKTFGLKGTACSILRSSRALWL
jgi:hypothetical protein